LLPKPLSFYRPGGVRAARFSPPPPPGHGVPDSQFKFLLVFVRS
jgi:hypothetical protein